MKSSISPLFITLILSTSLLAGCGGGRGGETSSSLNYTGVTTEAAVTSANGNNLTQAALGSTDSKGLGTIIGVSDSTEHTTAEGLSPRDIALLLTDLRKLFQPSPTLAAGGTINQTVYGDCGGSATISAIETVNGDYRRVEGAATFRNFCSTSAEGYVVLDGGLTLVQEGTPANFVLEVNTPYLYFAVGARNVAYAMEYKLTVSGSDATAYFTTANFRAPDGKVYRLEGYKVDMYGDGTVYFSADKLYHPDHGYVVLSTLQAMEYSTCGNRPLPGELRMLGSSGTYVDFRSVDCDSYEICINSPGACSAHSYSY